jgi:hypothetical protein
VLEDWLSGDEPVPLAGQKLFAAILNRPVRDLFTDIPPDGKPPRPPEPPASPPEPSQNGAAETEKPAGTTTASNTQAAA